MTAKPRLLLVYLGPELPRYAAANIRYLCRTFPDTELWIACDSVAVERKARRAGARPWRFDARGELRTQVQGIVGLDPHFRSGFWVNTMLRLWAVAEFCEVHADAPTVHIEADVWLSPVLDLERLCRIDAGIAYPLVDADGGAASILIVRESAVLRRILATAAATGGGAPMSDMALLGKVQADVDVRILPTAPDETSCFHIGVDAVLRRRMCEGLETVGGILDAATWGQYLLGLDARNARGRREVFMDLPHHAIDCRGVGFSTDAAGGLTLTGAFGQVPVLALHVHSKDAHMFTNPAKLLRLRVQQAPSGPRTELDVSALTTAVVAAIARRLRLARTALSH